MKKIIFILVLFVAAIKANGQAAVLIKDKFDRTPIEIADIQNHITDHITRNYPGFIINQATRVVKSNVITYEIIIVQGTTTDTLFYDQNYVLVHTIVHADSIKPVQKLKRPI
jgi:hypothetical protein